MIRIAAVVLGLALTIAAPPLQAVRGAHEGDGVSKITTTAIGGSLTAAAAAALAGLTDAFSATARTNRPEAPPLVRHMRAEICGVYSAGADAFWPCSPDVTYDHSDRCGDRPALRPWWESTRTSPGAGWGDWTLVADVTCVGEAQPSPEEVLTEFRRLPIAPSALHVQPDRGWVLVNKETIAYTDPGPQVLTTDVLGTTVTFTVTPATFTWDYGERVFTTTSPGHPYPDQDVSYPYERPGTGQVTVTTTWTATYTLADDPASFPVPGTAITTTASSAFQIREATAHLTRGSCDQYPDDPGC
ncbi:MAG: hypothetical protein L6311_04910 [Cellulomonas sp.]|nr:hypothetical protein [Cellulomonas sp.]